MLATRSLFAVLALGALLPAAETPPVEEEATPVSELESHDFPLRNQVKRNPGSNKATARTPLVESLTFRVFNELAASREGNICFAPASLEDLLQLLRAGAAGKTQDALGALPYGNPDGESARHLHSVSALFADSGLAPTGGEVAPGGLAALRFVPFATDPQGAATAIDAWCRRASGGHAPALAGAAQVNEATRLLAVNATFMRKKWQTPFDPAATLAHTPFRKADGTDAPVAMMRQFNALRYAEGADWRAVELDYRNRNDSEPPLCFIAILPKGDARALAKKLTRPQYDSIRRALSAAEPRHIVVALPRMEIASTLSFRNALGKPDEAIFADKADFSRLLPGQPARLDDLLQACRLDVAEESGGSVDAPALHPDFRHPIPPCIRFDRPFIWAVDDLTTGAAPSFLGLYEQP